MGCVEMDVQWGEQTDESHQKQRKPKSHPFALLNIVSIRYDPAIPTESRMKKAGSTFEQPIATSKR